MERPKLIDFTFTGLFFAAIFCVWIWICQAIFAGLGF